MGADHVSYCKKNECCMPNGNWTVPDLEGNATTGRKKYQCRPPVEGKCSVMANSFFHKENYSRCIRSNAGQKKQVELVPGPLTAAGENANLVNSPAAPAGVVLPNA